MDTDESQAMLIRIDEADLGGRTLELDNLFELEDRLTTALGDLGECDGDDIGRGTATIYLYGPDADAMFVAIEPILRADPLTADATVVIRYGSPGDRERTLRLQNRTR
jgi:hypothetical protein